MFNVPHFAPQTFDVGQQIFSPGQSGGGSHPHEAASAPRMTPTPYAVTLMGIGAMPRFVMGPTLPIDPNTYAGNNQTLMIPGAYKKSSGNGY